MKTGAVPIVPMRKQHVPACRSITATSDPWKTLREEIDFSGFLTRKESFVALINGQPAGFVIFTPQPVFARGGYLRAIGVALPLRGQGIGKQLLTFAERTTAALSPNLYLCVSSFNRPARLFYEHQGYRRVGAIPGLIAAGSSEWIYWKRLVRAVHDHGGKGREHVS